MSYARPIIRVRENNRFIDRGAYFDSDIGRHVLQATNEETFKVNLDYADDGEASSL